MKGETCDHQEAVAVVTMTRLARVMGSVMEGKECLEMLASIYSFTGCVRPAKALYQAWVQW